MSNILKINPMDNTNGPGCRVSIFLAGCSFPLNGKPCPGCFNQEAWDFDLGDPLESKAEEIYEALKQPFIRGVSILGGEPLAPQHQWSLLSLLKAIKHDFPDKDVWLWTGYVFKDIPKTKFTKKLLSYIDVIVDGPFLEAEFNDSLRFRGSKNQKILRRNKFGKFKEAKELYDY